MVFVYVATCESMAWGQPSEGSIMKTICVAFLLLGSSGVAGTVSGPL